MSLRLKDLKCVSCGVIQEDYMVVTGDPLPRHCGKTMGTVWLKAPSIDYKPHYSHALGRRVETTKELDKELEKKGQWVATKSEANSTYGTDIFEDNVAIKQATKDSIRKHVEKAARKLTADGVLRSGKNGWEHTGGDSAP